MTTVDPGPSGPLRGIKIVELAGMGPTPFACMLLAELGADVLRLGRGKADAPAEPDWDLLNRSRHSVAVDFKNETGRELVLELCEQADVLVEGFRPGVTERLGLGPLDVFERNPRIVYGRMTGYGQEGPLAQQAGHDINYIAISGALWPVGRVGDAPVVPLNLVGDYGGGSLYLALGVVSALLHVQKTGQGQVVDAAMVDGSASLMATVYSFMIRGQWSEERGTNLFDSGAHFYEVYETSDGKFMAVGAIEEKFYDAFLRGLGLEAHGLAPQMDREQWPAMKRIVAQAFARKTREEWTAIFEELDACVSPVLSPSEAPFHPHNRFRQNFSTDGVLQPQPAPRFSQTPGAIQRPARRAGSGTREGLLEWGISEERLLELGNSGAFG